MRDDLTELVFILDRSGSMSGLEGDTIEGYNALLAKQRDLPGEAIVTTVLFDDRYELLHDRTAIKGIRPIAREDYYVRGSTAMLDAIGKTIDKIGSAHRHTEESQRPGKTLVAITTDGMENASREYTNQRVRQMIEHQKAEFGWEFLFLGANMDAVAAAQGLSIPKDRAATYRADGAGTSLNFASLSDAAESMRANRPLGGAWKRRIEEDQKRRSGKA